MTILHHPILIIGHLRSPLQDRPPQDMGRQERLGHGGRGFGLVQVLVLRQVMSLVIEVEIRLVEDGLVKDLQIQTQEDCSVDERIMQGREAHGQAQVLHFRQVGMKAQGLGLPAVGDLIKMI